MNYLYPPSKSVDIVKLIYSEQPCVNILSKKKTKNMQCTELTCTLKKVLKAKWKQPRSLKFSSCQLVQCPSYSPICQCVIYPKLKSSLENTQWILRFFYEYHKKYLLFKIIFKILLSHILILNICIPIILEYVFFMNVSMFHKCIQFCFFKTR